MVVHWNADTVLRCAGLSSRGNKKTLLTPTERDVHRDTHCFMVMGPCLLQKLAVGSWRLVVGNWWRLLRLVVGSGWRLVVVGSGWRLAVGAQSCNGPGHGRWRAQAHLCIGGHKGGREGRTQGHKYGHRKGRRNQHRRAQGGLQALAKAEHRQKEQAGAQTGAWAGARSSHGCTASASERYFFPRVQVGNT